MSTGGLNAVTGLAPSSGDTRRVLNHLPNILRAEQHDEDISQCPSSDHLGDDHELLFLRIVVREELFPITDLATADELSQAFYGIFKCYRWVYEKAHLMHRDISRNTLMVRKVGEKFYGVLNDFDLAVIKSDLTLSTSNHRTGTAPYMALDLLKSNPPPPHIVRFDLESLYYVFAYIVCQYHEGKKIDNPPFDKWDHFSAEDLYDRKVAFLATHIEVPQTPNFTNLADSTEGLHDIFFEAYQARGKAMQSQRRHKSGRGPPPPAFDNETLGNHITFDTFEKILKETLPSLA